MLWPIGLIFALIVLAAGCASPKPIVPQARAFVFRRDTFAFANDLRWVYYFDEQGRWTHRPNDLHSDYTHYCFVVVRSAKQFFLNARFDPTAAVADEATYRRLVRAVLASDPRNAAPEAQTIVIPGYADLHAFSGVWEHVLKKEGGSFWQSYFQRGNWRMVFPFSRSHQQATAEQLLASVRAHRPAAVHLASFPSLTINHAVLLYDAKETDAEIEFAAYDPNEAREPTRLTFDRAGRTFRFPANRYFAGGEVNAYEVYVSRCY